MTTYPIPGIALHHAQRLCEALQADPALVAEQYGNEIIANTKYGPNRMAERIACRPDDEGELRWWWSWGKPITTEGDRPLSVDEIDALVEKIGKVVGLVVPRP